MSYDIIQKLVDQLEEEKPGVRKKAMQHLAAIGDPSAVTALSNIYYDDDEPADIRNAAAEALGVFKAIQEAVEQGMSVELPDPAEVRPPRVSVVFLRRLVRALVLLFLVLVLANVAVAIIPPIEPPPPPLDERTVLMQLTQRYEVVRQSVDAQRAAWEQFEETGSLACDVTPDEKATGAKDLEALIIDANAYFGLSQANLQLIKAIDELTIPAGNWLVGCNSDAVTSTAAENFRWLNQASASLDGVVQYLDMAEEQLTQRQFMEMTQAVPTEAPPTAVPTAAPPTAIPTPAATPLPDIDYVTHIRGMRERIDYAVGARGVASLLNAYWEDVINTGQSFGCRQAINPFDPKLANYEAITPEVAALDSRLEGIASVLNVGLAMTRDSITNFQRGCSAGSFATVQTAGKQQVEQALFALDQAAQLLQQLQNEVRP